MTLPVLSLWVFLMRGHAASMRGPCFRHLLSNAGYLEYYYACRRQQSCQYEGTGDFGTSPIFVQPLDKPLLASVSLLGVLERKTQWPIEKLLR